MNDKWAEISIYTTQEATEAVAAVFHELGAGGVVIEDPDLIQSYRLSGNWTDCIFPDEPAVDYVTVVAYLPADAQDRLLDTVTALSAPHSRCAIENVAQSGATLLLYSVNAITTGTDAQGEVTVRLSREGRIVNGQGADTDG